MRDFGPGFMYIMLTFNFVIQLTFIVAEKENKLKESMGQMGLNRWVRPMAAGCPPCPGDECGVGRRAVAGAGNGVSWR